MAMNKLFPSKWILVTISIVIFSYSAFSQGVGINSSGANANSKSMLDIDATGKGLLIPRMTWVSKPTGLTSSENGLLIFSSDGDGTNGSGFYYWNGNTSQWEFLINGSAVGTGFILNGATLQSPARFRIDGNGIFDGGNIGVGTITPGSRIDINNTLTSSPIANLKALNVLQNSTFNTTASVLTNYGAYLNNSSSRASGINNLINVGIYSSASNAQFNYAAIFDQGNIGMGSIAPAQKLDVVGDINTSAGFRINNTASTGTFLRGNGTKYVSSTLTLPNNVGVNSILYASSTDVISGLTTANNATLVTNGSGVPSWLSSSSTGILGYWTRTGTVLSPSNTNDLVSVPIDRTIGFALSGSNPATGAATGDRGGVSGLFSFSGASANGFLGFNSNDGFPSNSTLSKPVTAGVYGIYSGTTSDRYGIFGENENTDATSSTNKIAIYGRSNNTNGNRIGVLGDAMNSGGGNSRAGVLGLSGAASVSVSSNISGTSAAVMGISEPGDYSLFGYSPTSTAGNPLIAVASDIGGTKTNKFRIDANGQITTSLTTAGFVKTTIGGVLSSSSTVALTTEVSGVLPVSNGGTGLSTVTSNGILVGNGTGNLSVTAAPSVTGQVLQWNGSTWVPTAFNGIGWGLNGNSGTNPASNYIGTSDAQDLVFRTTGSERARILSGSATVLIGSGENTSSPSAGTLRAPNASGTNITGANLNLNAGWGTGTAAAGSVFLNGGTSGGGANGNVYLRGGNSSGLQGGVYINDNAGGSTFLNVNGGVVSIGNGTPGTAQVNISNGLVVDRAGLNNGSISSSNGTTTGNGITFGSSSGEGIASNRANATAGTNQFGLDFYTSSTRRLSITNAGSVGIGTVNPTAPLQVVGNSTTPFDIARFDGSNTIGSALYLNPSAAGGRAWNVIATANSAGEGAGKLLIKDIPSGLVRMTIEGATGNVGIGTTSSLQTLDVNGRVNVANGVIQRGGTAITTTTDLGLYSRVSGSWMRYVTNNGSHVWFTDDGIGTTERMRLSETGYLAVGNPSTGSVTRTESKTFFMGSGINTNNGWVSSSSLGTITTPTGVNFTVTKVVYSFNGYHEDGNETHQVEIQVGASSFGNISETSFDGYTAVDWTNTSTHSTSLSSGSSVVFRAWDYNDNCFVCSNDRFYILNGTVTVYYTYTVGPQTGDILASGRVYTQNVTSMNQIGDLAEHFKVNTKEGASLSPGMIVQFDVNNSLAFKLADEPYSQHISGVISENPSVMLNSPAEGSPIALTGRVKVNLKPGMPLVKKGDFITSSDAPGLGQVAVKMGTVVGFAINDQLEGNNEVEILLQPGRLFVPLENSLPKEGKRSSDGNSNPNVPLGRSAGK
jgi:hypothetical protein